MIADPVFDTLLTQADTLAQAGLWVEAFEHLTQAHALRPRHTGTVNGLGTCLLRLGRPLEARPYFQQASELAPTQPEAQNNLGVAFASSGDGALAEAAYQCALALDPDHQPAWRNLAQLRLQQGQWGEGAMMLAAVVQAHPDDIEALILLAGCYEQGEQPDSARFLYQRVLSADPHNSTAATALGRLALAPVAPAPAAPRGVLSFESAGSAKGGSAGGSGKGREGWGTSGLGINAQRGAGHCTLELERRLKFLSAKEIAVIDDLLTG